MALIIIALAVFAPFAWLNAKIAGRRNWARITYIVLELLGVAFSSSQPERLLHSSLVEKGLFTVQTVMQLTAVALLLSPGARRWFKPSA